MSHYSDCCGQYWYVHVANRFKGKPFKLLLCRHHWIAHEAALTAGGWVVVNDRLAELNCKP